MFLGKKFKSQLDSSMGEIRREFNDHLETINDNTSEIQINFEYLQGLDQKISKLSERIDNLQCLIEQLVSDELIIETNNIPRIQPLNNEEKRIFLALYTNSKYLSYDDLAYHARMNLTLLRAYLTNLIEKGVPLIKKYIKGKPYVSLDSNFKELQAKHGLIKIDKKITEFLD